MISFAIKFNKLAVQINARCPQDSHHQSKSICRQHVTTPLGDEDQVSLQTKHATTASSLVVFLLPYCHAPVYGMGMKRQQGYKYRLDLPDGAATKMSQYAGCARLVWNLAVVASKKEYPGNGALSAMLTTWKRKVAFLRDADSIALQQSLRNFDRAWQNYFQFPEHFDRPTFKRRDMHSSFRIVGAAAARTKQGQVWLPKFGWVSYRDSRPWLGAVKSVTYSRKAGRWYVSIMTERDVSEPKPRRDTWVGIDVGIAQYATLSTGVVAPSIFAPPPRAPRAGQACPQA